MKKAYIFFNRKLKRYVLWLESVERIHRECWTDDMDYLLSHYMHFGSDHKIIITKPPEIEESPKNQNRALNQKEIEKLNSFFNVKII